MKYTSETRHIIDDSMMEQITGGNDAQYGEIVEFIRTHDPEFYDFMMHMPNKSIWIIRYLYDNGIPVIGAQDWNGVNVYTVGTVDRATGRLESTGYMRHEELMAMLREKLG